ncbi:DUF6795 domain-containing protein [Rubrivivax gelatinosus]|uniref:DUF6795 domain-containing protein n=1 Tax=Rubrivivax gelatinosus TaxID=28068 RepID=UPI003D31FB34
MHQARISAILITTLLYGCVPFPNVRYYAPAISGVVTQDGNPVVSAEVRVTGQFSNNVHIVASDQAGRFASEPIRKMLLTASLMGDPLYGYAIEIVHGGKVYAGYSESSVGYAPKELKLSCELAKPIQRGNAKFHCTRQETGA